MIWLWSSVEVVGPAGVVMVKAGPGFAWLQAAAEQYAPDPSAPEVCTL